MPGQSQPVAELAAAVLNLAAVNAALVRQNRAFLQEFARQQEAQRRLERRVSDAETALNYGGPGS